MEVCTKFGGDWSRSSCVKEGHRFNSHFYIYTNQPSPGAAREKFDELTSPIWRFYITQNFLFCDPFGVWSTPGSMGWVGGVMLVLRTFPELAGRSVQYLVEIGPAVWA